MGIRIWLVWQMDRMNGATPRLADVWRPLGYPGLERLAAGMRRAWRGLVGLMGAELVQPALAVLWAVTAGTGFVGLVVPYPEAVQVAEEVAPPVFEVKPLAVELAPPAFDGVGLSPAGMEQSLPAGELVLPEPSASVSVPAAMVAPDLPALPELPVAFWSDQGLAVEGSAGGGRGEYGATSERGSGHGGGVGAGAGVAGTGSGGGVQALVLGVGEGRQPAPPYPLEARRRGQEGVVRIRFCVGQDGRVLWAEALDGCSWPLLRDAALTTVRRWWRFRPGEVRLYEVEIRFELARAEVGFRG